MPAALHAVGPRYPTCSSGSDVFGNSAACSCSTIPPPLEARSPETNPGKTLSVPLGLPILTARQSPIDGTLPDPKSHARDSLTVGPSPVGGQRPRRACPPAEREGYRFV